MPGKVSKATIRKIRTTKLRRIAYFDRETLDKEKRTVELAFSSEEPVDRWFGEEILDHSKKSVRLDRLRKTGPLLMHHDSREHIGTIDKAKIDKDRVGRAVVRLGRGSERDEILDDIENGIRKCVSVGYRIHKMRLEESSDDAPSKYRAIDWEPYEVSLVSMPADTTVGVGRDAHEWTRDDESEYDTIEVLIPDNGDRTMPETAEQKTAREAQELADREEAARVETTRLAAEAEKKTDAESIRKAELARIRLITQVGEKFNQPDLAKKAVDENKTVAEFSAMLLETMPGAKKRDMETASPEDASLGLSNKERKRFSFLKLIRSQAYGRDEPDLVKAAAFEHEVCREASKLYKRASNGVCIPNDVLLYGDPDRSRDWRAVRALQELLSARVLTEGGAGASLIAEDLLAGSFIDLLRNRMVLAALGLTILPGLDGDVAIPRLTGPGAAFWLATDETDITEATQTLDQVVMTPKNVGALSVYTRQLLMQSSIAIEQLIRNDLATVLALAIDLAGLYGTGAAGQPTGIANTTGIGAPGTFAGPVPTFAEIVSLESVVANNNALVGNVSYLIETAMRGSLKTSEKFASTGFTIWEPGNTLNGNRAEVSNQVISGDVFFANWGDLLQGVWGGLDILVDPFTLSARMNTRIIAMWTTDFAVRHPESFAFENDTP